MYRFIDDLSFSGIPLYGETDRGYALQDDFEFPPLSLSRDEIVVLMFTVEMLSRSSGYALADSAGSLLSKIGAALPPHSVDPASASLRALAEVPVSHDLCHWDCLHQAIQR